MTRAIIAVIILSIGIAIGSCLAVSRGSVRAGLRDLRPVIGKKYERLGLRARIVTMTWADSVQYRFTGSSKDRWCSVVAWRRWAETK